MWTLRGRKSSIALRGLLEGDTPGSWTNAFLVKTLLRSCSDQIPIQAANDLKSYIQLGKINTFVSKNVKKS